MPLNRSGCHVAVEMGMTEPANITLVEWLEADDASSREFRARRLASLLEALSPSEEGMGFWGGMSAAQSFTEMRLAYMHGLYLSTVLLALACIEQELAGMLHVDQWEKAKAARLEGLLREGRDRQLVSEGEFEAFQHLRDVRNAYAHYRDLNHQSAWVRRAINQDMPLEDVLEADALQAVQMLGTFLRRRASYLASARAKALTPSPTPDRSAPKWQTFAPPPGWFLLRR
jgi:hypothetical protein